MSDHACSEMYALMKELARAYQEVLDDHAHPWRAERLAKAASPSLCDVRQEMRRHQRTCRSCRHTMRLICMQKLDRERVA